MRGVVLVDGTNVIFEHRAVLCPCGQQEEFLRKHRSRRGSPSSYGCQLCGLQSSQWATARWQ
eukprot:4579913-Heterocapsa_arctica.AAC.1